MGTIPIFICEVHKMSEEILWKIFALSGRVDDYLRYRAAKDNTDDNSRRHSAEGAFGRRTG